MKQYGLPTIKRIYTARYGAGHRGLALEMIELAVKDLMLGRFGPEDEDEGISQSASHWLFGDAGTLSFTLCCQACGLDHEELKARIFEQLIYEWETMGHTAPDVVQGFFGGDEDMEDEPPNPVGPMAQHNHLGEQR